MPTYEYECKQCGSFEMSQKISDKPLDECPKCKNTVKRLISAGAGIIFKGSGFYATDYRRKPNTPTKKNMPNKTCPRIKEGCDGCKSAE